MMDRIDDQIARELQRSHDTLEPYVVAMAWREYLEMRYEQSQPKVRRCEDALCNTCYACVCRARDNMVALRQTHEAATRALTDTLIDRHVTDLSLRIAHATGSPRLGHPETRYGGYHD